MYKLIDTHIHLDDKRFVDVDKIINDFDKDEICAVINNSCDFSTMQKGYNLSQQHEKVYCTIGSHPHEACKHDKKTEEQMESLFADKKVVAVGEIGLDYHYNYSDRETQKKVFIRQLEMAHAFKLPVTVHLRESYGDALDVLKANKHLLSSGGVLHCYSGSAELAKIFVKLGLYISFTGVITFPTAKMDEIIRSVPIEKVLSETDGPYLAPVPFRGTVNFPRNVKYVVEKLAKAYDANEMLLRKQILQNAKDCFPKLVL